MRLSSLSVGLAALALATGAAHAEPAVPGPVYAVTYFEVAPSTTGQTAALLRQYVEAGRKAPGNAGFEAFEETGRPSRFATLEAWRDKSAEDGHAAATSTFEDQQRSRLISPFDVRRSSGLSIAAPEAQPGGSTVYVLTHVDVAPTGKDQGQALLEELANAARAERGDLWFNVLQQANRPNHFTLVEAWRDRAAFDTHIDAASTREFRGKLKPLQGALYDERLYRGLH